jgi:hypothetical protein
MVSLNDTIIKTESSEIVTMKFPLFGAEIRLHNEAEKKGFMRLNSWYDGDFKIVQFVSVKN